MADTLFNMSFDELIAQVGSGGGNANAASAEPQAGTQPAAETPSVPASDNTAGGTATSFDEMVEKAQSAASSGTGSSFDDMVAQAQNNTAAEPAGDPKATETASKQDAPAPSSELSFDDLVAKAQAEAAGTTQPDGGTKADEAPASAETVQETKADASSQNAEAKTSSEPETFDEMVAKAQAQATGTPAEKPEEKTEEVQPEIPDASDTKPTETQEAKEVSEDKNDPEDGKEAKEEKPKKTRKTRKKKAEEKPEEGAEEAPIDTTDNYRVDILENGVTTEMVNGRADNSTMDVLFSPEEVAAIRKDIRAFVRKELKMAMVDAMKELLNDFSK